MESDDSCRRNSSQVTLTKSPPNGQGSTCPVGTEGVGLKTLLTTRGHAFRITKNEYQTASIDHINLEMLRPVAGRQGLSAMHLLKLISMLSAAERIGILKLSKEELLRLKELLYKMEL